MIKKIMSFLSIKKEDKLQFKQVESLEKPWIAPEDARHHSEYLATSCTKGVGVRTPSPIEVVLEQSRMGIDNFDYLLTFGPNSCHYEAIKEFLRICPNSESLCKFH